jgi:hypothetical protein
VKSLAAAYRARRICAILDEIGSNSKPDLHFTPYHFMRMDSCDDSARVAFLHNFYVLWSDAKQYLPRGRANSGCGEERGQIQAGCPQLQLVSR